MLPPGLDPFGSEPPSNSKPLLFFLSLPPPVAHCGPPPKTSSFGIRPARRFFALGPRPGLTISLRSTMGGVCRSFCDVFRGTPPIPLWAVDYFFFHSLRVRPNLGGISLAFSQGSYLFTWPATSCPIPSCHSTLRLGNGGAYPANTGPFGPGYFFTKVHTTPRFCGLYGYLSNFY